MKTFNDMLKDEIMGEMLDIILGCDEPVDEELLNEFLVDTEFLSHIYDHGTDVCFACLEEGLQLKDAVDSVTVLIGDCFDELYEIVE